MGNQVPLYNIIRNIISNGVEYEKEVRKWKDNSDENKKIYRDLLHIWQVTGSFPDRFYPDRPKAWKKIEQHIHSQKKKHDLYHRMAKIAAAIIVIFLSVWTGKEFGDYWQQVQFTEVYSPAGQKTRIILPDSSVVLLNSNSKIRYSQNFNKKNRNVELRGEAYFEVQKDLSRQFIVSTSELDVKVFGTTFNVKDYDDEQVIEVGLLKGQIGIDCDKKEIVKLTPGMVATLNKKDMKLNVGVTDMNLVSAWTRQEMVFEEDSMEDIVRYIERWYGVEIQVAPELLDGDRLTFKVKTETLTELLNLINLLKPIKYHIDGKLVIITEP
ncbi:MAG: FecR domain-containing protein [Bacteroidales bacterium]|nr:FecR domain-containing protein [Bacteroidales bacterium]